MNIIKISCVVFSELIKILVKEERIGKIVMRKRKWEDIAQWI